MSYINNNNLGYKVTSRDINWLQEVMRAWGSEFHAPDHGIYVFGNGRKWDSTDMGKTGVYGVQVNDVLLLDDGYPDMRTEVLIQDYENIIVSPQEFPNIFAFDPTLE